MNALIGGLRAAAALAGVTVREAARQHLWIVFAGVALVLCVALGNLSAVDPSARLKLAVVVVTTGLGFAVTLLAMLVGPSQLRRDLDARVGMMLFSKPLTRLAYLGGRWFGVIAGLAMGSLALAAIGSALIAWRVAGLPEMRRIERASSWQEISSLGEVIAVKEGRKHVVLGGAPGNAVRFHLERLPHAGPEGLEVLVRVDLRSFDPNEAVEYAGAEIVASASAAFTAPTVLALDPASPYGHGGGDMVGDGGSVQLRSRDESHQDLSQDYCRLRLPGACISPSGDSWIQVVRLEGRAGFSIDQTGTVLAAVPGGNFLVNLVRGSCVLLAQAGLLTAFALLIACVSNLGVTLLGSMTLFFAGNALDSLRDTLTYDDPKAPVRRIMGLALHILPDFDRFGVAAQLAAGQSIGWDMVAAAWVYYGAFAVLFLMIAWFTLARREL